jgi:hypothetical protein
MARPKNEDGTESQPEAKVKKQYKITLHGEGGDVLIGHNYKLNVFKRNVETVIDEDFLDVLKNSVIKTKNEAGEDVSIPTHNYSVEAI